MTNKFNESFHEDMTMLEAQTVFFSLIKSCSEEEKKMLIEAFKAASDQIVTKELDYCRKHECMM